MAEIFQAVNEGRITQLNDIFLQLSPKEIKNAVQACDESGKTLLHYAGYYNYVNLVLYLLNKGADPFA